MALTEDVVRGGGDFWWAVGVNVVKGKAKDTPRLGLSYDNIVTFGETKKCSVK